MEARNPIVPKVSVIVPIYNVEQYLRPCVESIRSQTLTDLEIILVDDGSSDGCPMICDEYATIDPRIRVIHKANGGLSDARNAGLNVVCGDYVGFVDSDDLISPKMYELLYKAMEQSGAQIATCGFVEFCAEPLAFGAILQEPRPAVLNTREAMARLLTDKEIRNYAWDKLYAASLWREVRFPVGKKYEDVGTTYRVFDRADKVVMTTEGLYGYRIREDSIVHARTLAGELDCIEAHLLRYDALNARYPESRDDMVKAILHALVRVWPLAWRDRGKLDAQARTRLASYSLFSQEHRQSSEQPELGASGKICLALTRWDSDLSRWASWVLYRLYSRRQASKAI